jgi:hypothetical protein
MDKVERDVMRLLDADGNGKLDQEDARLWINKAINTLTCDTKISAGVGEKQLLRCIYANIPFNYDTLMTLFHVHAMTHRIFWCWIPAWYQARLILAFK